MRQRTPAYPGNVAPGAESPGSGGVAGDHAADPPREAGHIYATRAPLDAWPDSGRWPDADRSYDNESPLPAFRLDGLDEPAGGEKDSWHDRSWQTDKAIGSQQANQHPSTAPQSMDVEDGDLELPPPRSTRRRATVILAAVVASPFVVLALYVLATRGLGAWQPPAPASVANGVPANPTTVRLEQLPPQQRAYRAAGDTMTRAGAQAALACRVPSAPPAALWATVSFAASGKVESAVVEGSPPDFPQIGRCVEQQLREMQIAPFQGEPVEVARAISVK